MAKFTKYEPHPLGALFPPMADEPYASLKKSLKERGFDKNEKIMLFEEKILDGNNRYTACKAVKIEPLFDNFKGTYAEAVAYVTAKNLGRRHLNPSQAAAAGAELMEILQKQEQAEKDAAAKLQSEKGKPKGKKEPKPKRGKGSKAAAAAKVLGVSERSVAKAAALKKSDPATFEKVKAGKTTLHSGTVQAGAKKSAADKASEAFAEAVKRLDEVCGEGFSQVATKKLNTGEIIKMSGLDKEEMLRIKPYIESGWTLKAALGFKSTQLTPGHTIRQLCDRAIGDLTAEGSSFKLRVLDFVIEVRKATGADDAPFKK